MIELNSRQRKALEKHAQPISAVIQIGQGGVTEGLISHVRETMAANELIKIKFLDFKDEKRELMNQICEALDVTLVRIIGNVAILYKPAEKADKRQYEKELSKLVKA